jgi:hypothetical protein
VPRIPSLGSWLILLAAVAGCHDPLTQVVVVFQSDLEIPTETDGIEILASSGPFAPVSGTVGFNAEAPLPGGDFPLSIGVDSAGATSTFSMTVQLLRGFTNSNPQAGPLIVVNRTITDIRFVDQKTMMMVVPLLRVCACQGTSCPGPGNPQCDSIETPMLLPFDAAVAPPSTMMSTGAITISTTPPGRAKVAAPPEGGGAP